jgi:receptor expression-enhancing protein 5/6
MLMSIKTIESDDNEETNMWLCFWTVFGIFQTAELFLGFIFYFIPYYSIVRILFFLYLMLPQTQGAKTLYTTVFRPTLKKYSPEIKSFIEKVTEKASEAQKDAMAAGSKMASEMGSAENMAKAAAMAGQA